MSGFFQNRKKKNFVILIKSNLIHKVPSNFLFLKKNNGFEMMAFANGT